MSTFLISFTYDVWIKYGKKCSIPIDTKSFTRIFRSVENIFWLRLNSNLARIWGYQHWTSSGFQPKFLFRFDDWMDFISFVELGRNQFFSIILELVIFDCYFCFGIILMLFISIFIDSLKKNQIYIKKSWHIKQLKWDFI